MLVVVHTGDGDILLLRRRQPFDFWQSVTGSLDTGEEPAQAARRELREETGLGDEGELCDTGVCRTFVIDPRWRDRYADGVTENVEHEWRYRLATRPAIRIDPDEHAAYCWMPLDDAVDAVWSSTNREALLDLRTSLQ